MFLGTPDFAGASLEALIRLRDAGLIDLVGVVTQPDRPGHRGRIQPPPVKGVAARAGVGVLQPARLRGAALEQILSLRPEALVWAAYGNLIPARLIDAVGGRALNVHASLLPRWRGAAPIAHAILARDADTGATLMQGTPELDAGPIVAQERTGIDPRETRGELEARLAEMGAGLLERELVRYLAAAIVPRPQDPDLVTWAPKLDPPAGEIRFERPAEELARVVRAFTPDPGAFSTYRGARFGVLRASVSGGSPAEQGTLRIEGGVPRVATGAGWLRLDEVRPPGKRAMTGAEWARGQRDIDGRRLPS